MLQQQPSRSCPQGDGKQGVHRRSPEESPLRNDRRGGHWGSSQCRTSPAARHRPRRAGPKALEHWRKSLPSRNNLDRVQSGRRTRKVVQPSPKRLSGRKQMPSSACSLPCSHPLLQADLPPKGQPDSSVPGSPAGGCTQRGAGSPLRDARAGAAARGEVQLKRPTARRPMGITGTRNGLTYSQTN